MNAVELAEHAGITYRQVDWWTRSGLIRPDNPDCGSGRHRRYPPEEVRAAERIAGLVRAGVHVQVAARIARGEQEPATRLRKALEAS